MSTDTTRDRILHAAGAAFAERGFKAATVRDIAGRAGVNLASVNYHFGDKWRLYVETIKFAHRLGESENEVLQWQPETPPEQRLRDVIGNVVRRTLSPPAAPWQDRLMSREMLQPSGACREVTDELVRPKDEQLVAILAEMAPPDAPRDRLQKLAFSVIGQCMFYRVGRPIFEMLVPEEERRENYGQQQLVDHIAGVILAALGREEMQWHLPAAPAPVSANPLSPKE